MKRKFLVTKHYGLGMGCIVGKPTESKPTVAKTVEKATKKGKGGFTGKATVCVWELIDERELPKKNGAKK